MEKLCLMLCCDFVCDAVCDVVKLKMLILVVKMKVMKSSVSQL